MLAQGTRQQKSSCISRRRVVLGASGKISEEIMEVQPVEERRGVQAREMCMVEDTALSHEQAQQVSAPPQANPARVLVLNNSQDMAKEITMELLLELPGSSITFAPTIASAKGISRMSKFDLIVASEMLPDGPVEQLAEQFARDQNPPDLLIVRRGRVEESRSAIGTTKTYQAVAGRSRETPKQSLHDTMEVLGEDIREDLGNPLMEIISMAYVARASGELNDDTAKALLAIDKVAERMARSINGLEDEIRARTQANSSEQEVVLQDQK